MIKNPFRPDGGKETGREAGGAERPGSGSEEEPGSDSIINKSPETSPMLTLPHSESTKRLPARKSVAIRCACVSALSDGVQPGQLGVRIQS